MVQRRVIFGVERKVHLPKIASISEAELEAIEDRCGKNCEHGWFDSVVKDTKLHYRRWLPSGKPKAIVICAHATQSHSGSCLVMPDGRKYGNVRRVEMLNGEGYAVYAHDYYGHGYSEGTRWLIPNTWKNNLADYCTFVNLVAKQHESDIPIFLLGGSYGAVLTIHLARQFQDHPETGPKIDGVILTASAIEADAPSYPLIFLLRYIGAPLFPRYRPWFMPNPVSPDRIWNDPEILKLRVHDPAAKIQLDGNGTPYRLGTADNLLRAIEAVRKKAIPGFKVPYCLLHGTEDPCCPISGAEYFYETAETPVVDREFHRLEGVSHDIFATSCAEGTIKLLMDWIKKRLASRDLQSAKNAVERT